MAQRSSFWLLTGMVVTILAVAMVGTALAQDIEPAQHLQSSLTDKIEAELITELSAGPADFIVRFTEQPDLSPAYQMAWGARGAYVYDTLREVAERSQVEAKSTLEARALRYQTFIAGNELYVWAGNLDAAQTIAALPNVAYIRATRTYYTHPVQQGFTVTWAGDLLNYIYGPLANPEADYDWGILDVHADQFWSTFGMQGEGILVANIDTGVQWDHPALVNQYKCSANPTDPACWYDPSNICYGDMCDNMGHGTHTMGTMVADDDPALPYIAGMAPNSQWIACKGCEYNWCSDFALNACADWILAPGGDPDNRPHVVNNSWGGWGGDTWYLDKVNAWRAAGTFPAFSAGNEWSCDSLGSPGDYQESFGTTSHREWDRLISDFSSKGPSVFGHEPYTKPNISAPGENICSTVPGGWDCYYSGTSMASPHSAGAVALLWSCNPGLVGQIDQTFEILQDSADFPPAGNCGAPPDGEGNYTYGYGYLNVYASGLLWCGETGTLHGNVYDASTLYPIHLAHVYSTPGPYQTSTDESGYYQMTMMVGVYDVTAEAFGYYPSTVPVEIITDTPTLQDFFLTPAPSAVVSGTVTDATTGWPLYASIEIVGYPYGAIWTDPVTGYYSVTLPQGSSFDFIVSAWVLGYLPEGRTVGPFDGDATENFALFADLAACVAPGYQILPYGEDFEADDGDLDTYGYGWDNSWAWGSPSPYPGPGEAHSGENVWATNPYGEYYDGEDSYLESPDIDLSSLVGQWFDFSWWQWLVTEGCCDFVDVQVSNDGGMSWSTVYGPTSGWVDGQWTQHTLTLDPVFAVGDFRVRFHLYTDGSVTEPGWYLDDLLVGSCEPQEGGLVVGNVYETNLGMPLTGAEVSNDSGQSTVTLDTADPDLGDAFYVLFSPPGWHDHTASYPGYNTVTEPVEVISGGTVGHDFYLPAGHLVVDPTSLETTLELGMYQTLPLTLTNDGDGSAYFEIREANRGFIPSRMASLSQESNGPPSYDSQAFPKIATTPIDTLDADVLLIQDYDAWGYPAITSILNNNAILYDLINSYQIAAWDFSPYQMIIIPSVQGPDYNMTFNDNLAKFEDFIDDGGLMLMSFCEWYEPVRLPPFGGTNIWDGQSYNYIVESDHPIFTGVPNPYWGNSASHNSLINLLPDDRVLVTSGDVPGGNAVMVERDHGGGMLVAGGQTFEYGWGNGQGAGLILENMIPYYYFTFPGSRDVPWLSENPISGTLAADTSQVIEVTFDTTQLGQPGDYLATLNVENDTPYGTLEVPVTMTVVAPADWGKLEGQVSSLGYCDQEQNPLDEAAIWIQSSTGMSWTLETDENGLYSWWLDQDGSPYTVMASYPEHQDGWATGVVISGGATTTQDFSLRWLMPCVQAAPPALETSLTLGMSETLTITLSNTGGAATDFEFLEVDRGFNPVYAGTGHGEWLYQATQGVEMSTNTGDTHLAYPKAYRWTLDTPSALNVLIYADDYYHWAPNTFLDQALQALGIAYTAHYDGDFYGFIDDLQTGTWDLVLVGNDNYGNTSIFSPLNDYVVLGGKLAINTWTMSWDSANPLWTTLGVTWVSDDYDPPDPVYWWDPSHPIFTTPESVPEFTSLSGYRYGTYGQKVEPMPDYAAVAGYTTPGPDPNNAAMVVGNDGYTVFKGFLDGQNDADLDGDGWMDGVELWINLINGIQYGFAGDVPWLNEIPITGTLPADTGLQVVDVIFDASVVNQPGDYFATLNVRSDDPVNDKLGLPITMTVQPPEDWGKLTGTAESLGYCDLNPAPLLEYVVVVDVAGVPLTASLSAEGIYSVWLEQGTYTVTTSADEHVAASGVATITAGEVTTLDFGLRWMAPCISGAPTSYSVEVPQGYKFIFPFQVVNTGAGESEFELKDRTVQEIVFSTGQFAAPQAIVPVDQQGAATTEGLDLPPAPQAVILDAGEVLQSWSPFENDYAWGIAFDGTDDTVWVGDGWAYENTIFEYEPDGTPTGRSHQYDWGPYYGPADDAFNWNTGMLWTLDVGGDNCLHEMDPASGYTDNTICGPWYISQRGLAYDPATDTWFVGGWNDSTLYHIDSAGNLLDSAYVGLMISGLAYNPATLHLFVMVNTIDEPVYVLDVANNYQVIGQFYVDGWPNFWNGAGLEFDCDGNLWAVAQETQTVYQFESGETASLCEPGWDAPWLTEHPQEGTVLADSTYDIELAFTAFPTMSIGSYYTATLIIQSDDPVSDTYRVPVTMTVIAPVIEVSMSPTETTQASPPGTVVNYRLTVQNIGNVPDVYDLSLEDQDWPVMVVGDPVSLAPGEDGEISIFVFIPASAQDGEQDVMTVRATSQENSLVSATSELTTVALYQRLPRLTPSQATQIGEVGGMVEYHLILWNFSVVSDTIDLSVDSTWMVDLPFTSYTLDSFEYVEFTVKVYIPASAQQGDMDMAIIVATSQSDPLASDTSRLYTYAGIGKTYLPIIKK